MLQNVGRRTLSHPGLSLLQGTRDIPDNMVIAIVKMGLAIVKMDHDGGDVEVMR